MSRALDLYNQLVQGGGGGVRGLIDGAVSEELFLDYKRSANNGATTSLDPGDRANLAKAISGFGNSEGGIIVWGVDCRKDKQRGDVPSAEMPIQDPTRFKGNLEQSTSGLTIPPHNGVRHHPIEEGFVVSLVPSGMHAPYQNAVDQSYYIRAGSSFVKTPHAVLAGLFGRRPQPAIRQYVFPGRPSQSAKTLRGSFYVNLHNAGRGLAEDIFLNFEIIGRPGPNCQIKLAISGPPENWASKVILDNNIQMMTRPGIKLQPEGDMQPVQIVATLNPPFEWDFGFRGMCGCSGGDSMRFGAKFEPRTVLGAYERYFQSDRPGDAASCLAFNQLLYESLPQRANIESD